MLVTIPAFENVLKQSENQHLELRMIRLMNVYKNMEVSHCENPEVCFYFSIYFLDNEQALG